MKYFRIGFFVHCLLFLKYFQIFSVIYFLAPGLSVIKKGLPCQHDKESPPFFFYLDTVFYCVNLWKKVKVVQSCPALCGPMDYTVHRILQARILEWVAFPFSRGSSQPRDWTQVSHIAGRFFTSWATREACWPLNFK